MNPRLALLGLALPGDAPDLRDDRLARQFEVALRRASYEPYRQWVRENGITEGFACYA